MKQSILVTVFLAIMTIGSLIAAKSAKENHNLYIGTTSTLCTMVYPALTITDKGKTRYFTSTVSTTICPNSAFLTKISND